MKSEFLLCSALFLPLFKSSLDFKLPCPNGGCFVNFKPLTSPTVFSFNWWGFSSSLSSDQDVIITTNNPC